MNNTLSDMKAALDYAKMKVSESDKNNEDLDYWLGKVVELQIKIEDSIKLLEG